MQSVKIITVIFIIGLLIGCGNDKRQENFAYFTNYSRTFNDMNDRHLNSARRLGIQPVKSEADIRRQKGRVEEISSCRWYEIDDLTHSLPYLVPSACDLLRTIGKNFRDSLDSKGLPSHTIIVTSVLRTSETVKKLRRGNGNASANSAHVYGTTFDVAYARFKSNSFKETETTKLKSVLAEVLRDLRKKKQCYVRYEYKQGCFHITTR